MLAQERGQSCRLHGARAVVIKEHRTGLRKEPDNPQQKEDVAHPRSQKRLLGRGRRARLVVPEANQQIRGKAHNLPAHKQQQQAVGNQHAQHAAGKQREKAEEARVVFVVRHVAGRVNEDKQPNEGDHHQHHSSQRIEYPAELQMRCAQFKPVEVDDLACWHAMGPGG